jgi:hypothetical protein
VRNVRLCTEHPKYKVLLLAQENGFVTVNSVKPFCHPRKPLGFIKEMCRPGLLIKIDESKYKMGEEML